MYKKRNIWKWNLSIKWKWKYLRVWNHFSAIWHFGANTILPSFLWLGDYFTLCASGWEPEVMNKHTPAGSKGEVTPTPPEGTSSGWREASSSNTMTTLNTQPRQPRSPIRTSLSFNTGKQKNLMHFRWLLEHIKMRKKCRGLKYFWIKYISP